MCKNIFSTKQKISDEFCSTILKVQYHNVRVVNDSSDTVSAYSTTTLTWCPRSHAFYEYLRENEKVCETVLACLCWAQVESFEHRN